MTRIPLTDTTVAPDAADTMRILGDGDMQIGLDAMLDVAMRHLPPLPLLRIYLSIYHDHKHRLLNRDALSLKYGLPRGTINTVLREFGARQALTSQRYK